MNQLRALGKGFTPEELEGIARSARRWWNDFEFNLKEGDPDAIAMLFAIQRLTKKNPPSHERPEGSEGGGER